MNRRIRLPLLCALLMMCAAGCVHPDGQPEGPATDANAAPVAQETMAIAQKTVTEDGTVLARLENGMGVVIKATRTAPVVHVRSYVHAGGLYEAEWLGCGLSHLLEHLVAQESIHSDQGAGSMKPAKHVEKRTRTLEIGGQSNAGTSLDYTTYYISASASKTTDCIELIADQMKKRTIKQADFEREHGVVQRELEMGADNPARQMWYAHAANCFGSHPAAVPVIGHAKPLSEVTLEDVLAYHRRMYVPQNMVFAVVGDVDVEEVLRKIQETFASFPAGREPRHDLPEVQRFSGVRRVIKPHPQFRDTQQRMSFQTIPLLHEDLHALDVLAYILGRGRTSRLYQTLVRQKKLATSVSTSSWTPAWGKGIFTVDFRCDPNQVESAERAVIAELKRIADDGVSEDELKRAKTQKLADEVYGRQSAESIAQRLAHDWLSTGNAHFSAEYTAATQKVTADRVQAMARKYFTFDRMVITRMVPSRTFAVAEKSDRQSRTHKATFFRLPNGLRVVLQPSDAVGLVSMAMVCDGGILVESDKTNGLGALMMSLSTRGAGGRSANEIASFFDSAGGSLVGRTGYNSFYWQASVLKDQVGEAAKILGDVVTAPTMDPNELAIVRPLLLRQIRARNESPTAQLNTFFRRSFFRDSPLGKPTTGDANVVARATTEQLRQWHGKYIRAGSSVLAVYGNFDPAAVRTIIESRFAELPTGRVKLPNVKPRRVADEGELHVKPTARSVQQAGVMLAVPGMRVDNDDRFAITVLDTIISGYHLPSGWLHSELRGKQLVYSVHAYNWAARVPGAFCTVAGCQPGKVPEVLGILRKNLRRASSYKPTELEIKQAVNSILTAEVLGNQSMSDLAMQAALDELYGFGYDYHNTLAEKYREVTPADVLRVGRKYLSGGMVAVVVTPKPDLLKTDEKGRTKTGAKREQSR